MHRKILLLTIFAVTSSVTSALERLAVVNSDQLTLEGEFESKGREVYEG